LDVNMNPSDFGAVNGPPQIPSMRASPGYSGVSADHNAERDRLLLFRKAIEPGIGGAPARWRPTEEENRESGRNRSRPFAENFTG
jgi:hypothetical protein